MKTLLVVAGTVGLFTAPALAGSTKKAAKASKPVAVSVVEAPALAAEVAPAPQAPHAAAAEQCPLEIPELPADTSSALVPFPELERARPVVAAPKPAKASKQKAPVMKMGNDYVLGRRQVAAKPERDVEQIVPKSLSQAQVATVVQSHMADIQNCWDLVPKAERADACTAMLQISISDAGVVTDVEIEGNVPARAHQCMTSAVSKWAFPVAETRSDVEYGISLRSL